MKYFTFISHELAMKNTLDKAAREFLQEQNRKIIDSKDLEWFKGEINKQIEKLNAQYSRCTSLKPSWWQPGFASLKKADWVLNGIGSCDFYLYASKD
jgi:hypothetical protein